MPSLLAEDPRPFKALIAAWSLVVVVFAVAGFSSRWNYYYNFGLQNLVWQTPLTTLPVYAIEIIRDTDNLVSLLWLSLLLLLPFEVLRFTAAWAADGLRQRVEADIPGDRRTVRAMLVRLFGGDGRLFVDAIRAGLIVFIAFITGGIAGTRDYQHNVVEKTSRLPRIAAIMTARQDQDIRMPIACDTRPLLDRKPGPEPAFVGDPQLVRFLRSGAACSTPERSWRLLFRDDKYLYLFATVPDTAGRPDTLVLPNDDKLTLVMR